MRRVLVHIGCAKGGSSAIQKALRINHEELASRGIVVPAASLLPDGYVSGLHSSFFRPFIHDRQVSEIPNFADLLEAVADHHNATSIVLSAEDLSNPFGFERIFENIAARFDVQVVFYIRRQDEFLESSWQQWNVKDGGSLLGWMIRSIRVRGDWYRLLEPWADTFGDDHVTARVYDRHRLVDGDIFYDFCDVLETSPEGLVPPGETNRSYSSMLSRLVEGRPYLFDSADDHSFYDSVRDLATDLVTKRPTDPHLFSADEALAIMQVYAKTNELFRKRFLPSVKRPLFRLRREGSELSRVDRDSFERELLQLQIYSLHKELQELRNRMDRLT